jgi:hypothetical protein
LRSRRTPLGPKLRAWGQAAKVWLILHPSAFILLFNGIRHFMQMLRKGIKRTTPEQLARIEDKLETD